MSDMAKKKNSGSWAGFLIQAMWFKAGTLVHDQNHHGMNLITQVNLKIFLRIC